MTKLSVWIKNNLHNNIKNDLDSTLNALLKLGPPLKKNNNILEQKKVLTSSICSYFENNRENIIKYGSLYTWIESTEKAALNKKELKVIAKENRAVFRQARFFSNVLQHAIGSLTDSKFEKELQNQNQSTEDMKEYQEESGDCDEKEQGSDDDKKEESGDDNEKDQGNEKKINYLKI